ncbi:MAG: ATP-binding protein [Candidatus Eisenbacteria bacterium]|nr:ATP-binding protein [Candidatus Eisenbacteria bacterium]
MAVSKGVSPTQFSISRPAYDYRSFDQWFSIVEAQIENELAERIALVLKETLSNIREFQLGMDLRRSIFLQATVTPDFVQIIVHDSGPPWRSDGILEIPDAAERMQQLLGSLAERGRGHLMMVLLCDEVRFEHHGVRRVLTWQRNGRSSSPSAPDGFTGV